MPKFAFYRNTETPRFRKERLTVPGCRIDLFWLGPLFVTVTR